MFDDYSNRQLRHVISLQFAIILNLCARLDSVITEAETIANERLAELVQKQVDYDNQKLGAWQDNTQTLWRENQELKQQVEKLRQRRKESKRWEQ